MVKTLILKDSIEVCAELKMGGRGMETSDMPFPAIEHLF